MTKSQTSNLLLVVLSVNVLAPLSTTHAFHVAPRISSPSSTYTSSSSPVLRLLPMYDEIEEEEDKAPKNSATSEASSGKIREMASFLASKLLEVTLLEAAKGEDSKITEEQALGLLETLSSVSETKVAQNKLSTTWEAAEEAVQETVLQSEATDNLNENNSIQEASEAAAAAIIDDTVSSVEDPIMEETSDEEDQKVDAIPPTAPTAIVQKPSKSQETRELAQRSLLAARIANDEKSAFRASPTDKPTAKVAEPIEAVKPDSEPESAEKESAGEPSTSTIQSSGTSTDGQDEDGSIHPPVPNMISMDFGKALEVEMSNVPALRLSAIPKRSECKSVDSTTDSSHPRQAELTSSPPPLISTKLPETKSDEKIKEETMEVIKDKGRIENGYTIQAEKFQRTLLAARIANDKISANSSLTTRTESYSTNTLQHERFQRTLLAARIANDKFAVKRSATFRDMEFPSKAAVTDSLSERSEVKTSDETVKAIEGDILAAVFSMTEEAEVTEEEIDGFTSNEATKNQKNSAHEDCDVTDELSRAESSAIVKAQAALDYSNDPYEGMALEDKAFQILADLGMIEVRESIEMKPLPVEGGETSTMGGNDTFKHKDEQAVLMVEATDKDDVDDDVDDASSGDDDSFRLLQDADGSSLDETSKKPTLLNKRTRVKNSVQSFLRLSRDEPIQFGSKKERTSQSSDTDDDDDDDESRGLPVYYEQPRSATEESQLAAKYAAIPTLEERAHLILKDLQMI